MKEAIRSALFCLVMLSLLPIAWIVFVFRLIYEAGVVGWQAGLIVFEWLLETKEGPTDKEDSKCDTLP